MTSSPVGVYDHGFESCHLALPFSVPPRRPRRVAQQA
jgi:hypothetical protein